MTMMEIMIVPQNRKGLQGKTMSFNRMRVVGGNASAAGWRGRGRGTGEGERLLSRTHDQSNEEEEEEEEEEEKKALCTGLHGVPG